MLHDLPMFRCKIKIEDKVVFGTRAWHEMKVKHEM
jgi:hypothetical protein